MLHQKWWQKRNNSVSNSVSGDTRSMAGISESQTSTQTANVSSSVSDSAGADISDSIADSDSAVTDDTIMASISNEDNSISSSVSS